MTRDIAAETAETVMVSLEFALPDAPEKVWRALTEPQIVARWIAPAPEDGPAENGGMRRAEFVDAETNSRVSYRWRDGAEPDSVVTFSIAPDAAGGTRLRIVHSRMAVAPVAVSGALACRLRFGSRMPTACAANLNHPRARAA